MTILTPCASTYAADGALEGWTNPTNAYADDALYAARTGTVKNTWYGNLFGFDLSGIPDGATLNSAVLEVQWHNSVVDSAGPQLFLAPMHNGAQLATSLLDTSGETNDKIKTLDITAVVTIPILKSTGASGFRAILRFRRTDNTAHTAYVDYVRITVDYTVQETGISGTADIILGGATGGAAGEVLIGGAASLTLGAMTAQGAGLVEIAGLLDQNLEAAGVDAAGVIGSEPITGAVDISLDGMVCAGQGAVDISGGLTANLEAAGVTASGMIAVAGGLAANLEAANGAGGGVVAIAGGLAQVTDAVTAAASGAVDIAGGVSAALEATALSAAGALGLAVAGELAQVLGAVIPSITGAVEIQGAVTTTLDGVGPALYGEVVISGAAVMTVGGVVIVAGGELGAVMLTEHEPQPPGKRREYKPRHGGPSALTRPSIDVPARHVIRQEAID